MARKTQHNNLTSPELLAQVNPENLSLLAEFETYLRSIQRSDTTIASYHNDFEIFFCWLFKFAKNKFFVDITKRDIIAFQGWLLTHNKNSPARIRRIKSTLSSLGNYVEMVLDEDYPDFRNFINKIPSPINEPVRVKTVFSEEQVDSLLRRLVEQKRYQQACAVAIGAFSGSRKSEIPRFKVSYFDESNVVFGSLYKTPEKIKTKGRGNGKMLNKYTLKSKFDPYLKLWLEQRKELGIDSEWLFVTKDDKGDYTQLLTSSLNSWAQTFSNMMHADFYWHALRHYCCTALARSGLPDNVIKELFGWSSLDLVSVYKDIDDEEEIGKYFDDDGIKAAQETNVKDL